MSVAVFSSGLLFLRMLVPVAKRRTGTEAGPVLSIDGHSCY
jgi:hypothetical protein